MKVVVTGDIRDVANSAWVSTLDEAKAQTKTDEQVERVVQFLIDNYHTSPFESVTVTVDLEGAYDDARIPVFRDLIKSNYSRCDNEYSPLLITIDLLNFVKVISKGKHWSSDVWLKFSDCRPKLAGMLVNWGLIQDEPAADVQHDLEGHTMSVELVSLHTQGHARATWRVRCPLSIAVQILRHRAGSYNMTSGRYRTLTQEQTSLAQDCLSIANKANLEELFVDLFEKSKMIMSNYKGFMAQLKDAKKENLISNNEYKRMREFVRFVLPEGRMTELYVTYYVEDFYNNYKKLRDSEHAQKEHIWIAKKMDEVLKEQISNN